jgi:hypothetical protein
METSAAAETVNPLVPLTDPVLALTAATPMALPVARPELLIFTTPEGELVQVTKLVRSCVVPSVYVPLAANCAVVPSGIMEWFSITAMETSAAAETVNSLEVFTDPKVAVIADAPTERETASPEELTMAMAGCELAHVTRLVKSCVLLSVNVPVAVSCMVLPRAMNISDGVTATETSTAFETIRTDEPLCPPFDAIILTVPLESDVDRPDESILAMLGLVEVHMDEPVRSAVLPSLNNPWAWN